MKTSGSSDSHGQQARRSAPRALTAALALVAGFMVAEAVAGFAIGSLALLAHAGHMLTDVIFIVLTLVAIGLAGKATTEHTYGFHRTEVLAALVNALALWGLSVWVLMEAYRRVSAPPEIDGQILLVVGSIGVVVNVAAGWLVRGAAQEHEGVGLGDIRQHMLTDLLGSAALVTGAVLVWAFGWDVADPAVSVLIGALILTSTWRLLRRVVGVLLEGTPEDVDLYALCYRIEEIEGVTVIHDVHCWTLAPGSVALTAHLLMEPGFGEDDGQEAILGRIRRIAYEEFQIQHVTIQLETTARHCLEQHHLDHLLATARS